MAPLPTAVDPPAPRAARLDAARGEGLILPDDGPITVLKPRAGEDFSPLGRDRLTLVQSFRPDHDALRAAGYRLSMQASPASIILVCLPRSKRAARDLIARANASATALVLVDGQKTDGVDACLREVRDAIGILGVVSKGHGKLFWFAPRPGALDAWRALPQAHSDPEFGVFTTTAGVFSADGIDPASRLLARTLPATLPPVMADLGAGWGFLSAAILARGGVTALHLVEAEADALDLARRNIADPRATFHWADATRFEPPEPVDGIVMNPPFHTGRKAQPALGLAFIAASARILSRKGTLWMVSNRHLPYEQGLRAHFAEHDILAEDKSFRVWRACEPRQALPARTTLRRKRTRR